MTVHICARGQVADVSHEQLGIPAERHVRRHDRCAGATRGGHRRLADILSRGARARDRRDGAHMDRTVHILDAQQIRITAPRAPVCPAADAGAGVG